MLVGTKVKLQQCLEASKTEVKQNTLLLFYDLPTIV